MFVVEHVRPGFLFGVAVLLVAEDDMQLEEQQLAMSTGLTGAPNIILHRMEIAQGERFRVRYRQARAPRIGQRIPLAAVARKSGLRHRWVRINMF